MSSRTQQQSESDSYGITYLNDKEKISITIPSTTRIEFLDPQYAEHEYTYGDVYDFFVYLINSFSSDIIPIEFIGKLFENSKNDRINSISILIALFNAKIPEDYKGKGYGKILTGISLHSTLPDDLQKLFMEKKIEYSEDISSTLKAFRRFTKIVNPETEIILETPTIPSIDSKGNLLIDKKGNKLYNKLQLKVIDGMYSIISIGVKDDGQVFRDPLGKPYIYNLRYQEPKKNTALKTCEDFVGIRRAEDPTFTPAVFMEILSVTGRPWRFIDCWGEPSHIVATGKPSYPYAWVSVEGSGKKECEGRVGVWGGGIKKKSYNKMNNSSYDFSGGGRRKARRGKRKTARRSARKTARRSARRSARKTARRSARRSNRKRVFRGGANG